MSGMHWLAGWEHSEGLTVDCSGEVLVITRDECIVDSRTKWPPRGYPMEDKNAVLRAEEALEEALDTLDDWAKGGVFVRSNPSWYCPPFHGPESIPYQEASVSVGPWSREHTAQRGTTIRFMLYNEPINAIKTRRPRCKAVFGRAWQPAMVTIYGRDAVSLVDGTWGHWVYFSYRGQWYKFDVHETGNDVFDRMDLVPLEVQQ